MERSRVPSKEKRAAKHANKSVPGSQVAGNPFVNLIAAMLTAHTPLAEVLAIVREQVVAILAQPRAGSTGHLVTGGPAGFFEAKPDRASLSELRQGHLFHRTSSQSA